MQARRSGGPVTEVPFRELVGPPLHDGHCGLDASRTRVVSLGCARQLRGETLAPDTGPTPESGAAMASKHPKPKPTGRGASPSGTRPGTTPGPHGLGPGRPDTPPEGPERRLLVSGHGALHYKSQGEVQSQRARRGPVG